jgi:hypothetical protein
LPFPQETQGLLIKRQALRPVQNAKRPAPLTATSTTSVVNIPDNTSEVLGCLQEAIQLYSKFGFYDQAHDASVTVDRLHVRGLQ